MKKNLINNYEKATQLNDRGPKLRIISEEEMIAVVKAHEAKAKRDLEELGYVSLEELQSLKFPPLGLGVERDLNFKADKTLSQYHNEAIEAHRIIA